MTLARYCGHSVSQRRARPSDGAAFFGGGMYGASLF